MQVRETPPFAPVLMESTRAIGYSLEAAIADIIDNSVAAKAGKVQLSFFPVGDAYVSILDNGTGMDDAQMNIAMQYGSKSPTETRDSSDLGRYGLGLKTASLSQCRVLTVISKQGDQVIGRRWDLDYVIKTGAWSLLILLFAPHTERSTVFLEILPRARNTASTSAVSTEVTESASVTPVAWSSAGIQPMIC